MIFNFRMAEEKDVPKLYEMVRYAKKNVPDPDWFEAEDEGFLCRHIEKEGFTILALDDSKNNTNETIAAFLTVRFPRSEEDNLGEYLDLTEEEMQAVAHLEIAVVDPKYQGNSLQYRLFLEAEKILKSGWKGNPMHYLMATVHPDNRFSLGNMERIGMKVAADVIKYGGKRRYVMWKENI